MTSLPTSSRDVDLGVPVEVGDDPVAMRAALLRCGNIPRIKAALSAPLPPALASFVIPLLADDAVVRDAVCALRKIAGRATGQLLDALLDGEIDPRVRRRIPRVLKVCRTQRAASGMLMALRDPVFEVRVQVGLTLAQLHGEAQVSLPRDEVFDLALHELTAGRASWRLPDGAAGSEGRTDELHRGLAHAFTLLGLVLERERLSIAYRAIRSDDLGLRGTAYEYLEVVLPQRLRDNLIPLLGDVKPAARSRERGSKELAEELLRSSASLSRPATRSSYF